jgi:hypothetical protein
MNYQPDTIKEETSLPNGQEGAPFGTPSSAKLFFAGYFNWMTKTDFLSI